MAYIAFVSVSSQQHQFVMMDYFGLNILFLTITPDDECNFSVRLFPNPDKLSE